MPYNLQIANQIRECLQNLPEIEEKEMMGGLVFMYHKKMCVGIIGNEMVCRIDPDIHEVVVEKNGCRSFDFTKRPLKGYVMIDETVLKTRKDFEYWINLALDFNKKAKSSTRRKPKIK